jgi:hypothetical protein
VIASISAIVLLRIPTSSDWETLRTIVGLSPRQSKAPAPRHECCWQPGTMSFLEMHDLATVTAQSGVAAVLDAWWAEGGELLGGIAAVLAAVVLKRRKR